MLTPDEKRILEMLSQTYDGMGDGLNKKQMQDSPGGLLLLQAMQDPNSIQRLVNVIKDGVLANDNNALKSWDLLTGMANNKDPAFNNLNTVLTSNPNVAVINQQLKLNQLALNPAQMLKELAQLYNMQANQLAQPQGMQKLIDQIKLGLMSPVGGQQEKTAQMAADMLSLLYKNSPQMKLNIEKSLKANPVAISQLQETNGNFKNVFKASMVFTLLSAVMSPEDEPGQRHKFQDKLSQGEFHPFSDFGREQHNNPELQAKRSKVKPTLDEDEQMRLKRKK